MIVQRLKVRKHLNMNPSQFTHFKTRGALQTIGDVALNICPQHITRQISYFNFSVRIATFRH